MLTVLALATVASFQAPIRGFPASQTAAQVRREQLADGSNADDRGDYRPGRQAAREFGVLSPLDAASLSKSDIRALSHEAGLPTWDEPASACLSSRIPYHHEVTPEKLRQIERGEEALHALGFRVCRVRRGDRPECRPRVAARECGALRLRRA